MLKDKLATGFAISQFAIEADLKGVGHEESLKQPSPGVNCLNWLAGHILIARGLILTQLGEKPFLDEAETKPYGRGSPPLKPGGPCVALDRILEGIQKTGEVLSGKLESLEDSALEAPLDPTAFSLPVEIPTLGALLTVLLWHEGYHTGQLAVGLRLIGREIGFK